MLQELASAGRPRKAWPVGRPAVADAASGRSRVVLIHGPGGIGKSLLLRQFRAMALPRVRTAWLDWAQLTVWKVGPRAGMAEPGLMQVLGTVQVAIMRAFADEEELSPGRVAYEFRDYRSGADRMPEYLGRVQDVIERAGLPGFPCSRSDAATLMRKLESAGLAVFSPDHETHDPVSEEAARGPLPAVIAQAVTMRAQGELPPEEYALVTDPATELCRRFAAAVTALSRRRPLVVFADNGEVISDQARGWLHLVMRRTGPRVAWVVAGRFAASPEDGTDSQVGGFAREFGEELTPISPAPFDGVTISAYLKCRPSALNCTSEEIELIARRTGGLPLAVSLTAALLDDGATVAEACQEDAGACQEDAGACQETEDGRLSAAATQLARRYVAHAEARLAADGFPADGPRRSDAARILALALAYGPPDTDLLAALWGDSYPEDIFEGLASRHDFVPRSSFRLHDDVRDALRGELLDPDRRERVRRASERALTLSLARLKSARGRWPALDEQLGRPEFTSALLGAIWHASWVSNQAGLDLLTAVLPVLIAARPGFASLALGIAEQFTGTCTPQQRQDLDRLSKQPPDPVDDPARGGLIGQPGDRQAAALIVRAQRQAADNQHQEAVASLTAAAAATTSALLRKTSGRLALSITARLMRAEPGGNALHTDTSLAAAELAVGLLPDSAAAWRCYGPALRHAGRAGDALAAYRKAVEFHPDDATARNGLGATLRMLGRFPEALAATDAALILAPGHSRTYVNRGAALAAMGQFADALTAFDQALEVDPDNAVAHGNKGIALAVTGDLDNALAEFDAACRLDPPDTGESSAWAGAIRWHRGDEAAARQHFARVTGCLRRRTPFEAARLEAIARCALGDPEGAEQRLLSAIPLRSAGDRARPRAIYDLLADPPLPGIDRLRAIIERE